MPDLVDQIWNSPANQLPPASRAMVDRLTSDFAGRQAARRRRVLISAPVLGVLTLASVAALFDGDHGQLTQRWAVLPILAISWGLWVVLLLGERPSMAARAETLPLSEVWKRMLERNRRERFSLALIGLGIALTLIPLWLSVGQLQAAGQASPREGLQMGLLLSLGLLGGLCFVSLRYWRQLLPERARLIQLARDHAS